MKTIPAKLGSLVSTFLNFSGVKKFLKGLKFRAQIKLYQQFSQYESNALQKSITRHATAKQQMREYISFDMLTTMIPV